MSEKDEQAGDGADIDVDQFRDESVPKYGEDDSQDYIERDAIDFDPEDGLYSGTAVTGDSEIPDPQEVAQQAGEVDPTAAAPGGSGPSSSEGSEG